MIGVDRLYNLEAQLADQISRIHSDESIVLNYQDKVFGFIEFGHVCSGQGGLTYRYLIRSKEHLPSPRVII